MTQLSPSQVMGYAMKTGLTNAQATIATAIAMAESGGDTNAINPGHPGDPEYSVGLWQINIRAHPEYSIARLKDPQQNATAMFAISSGGTNWNPWGTYTSGAYRAFLSRATALAPTTPTPTPTTTYQPQTSSTPSGFQSIFATPTSSQQDSNTDAGGAPDTTYKYILAYVVAGAIFILLSKTRLGYHAIYYLLALSLLLLLVIESGFIVTALAPLTQNDTGAGVNYTPVS